MIPVSTAEKNFGKKTFFVSTFLDKYKDVAMIQVSGQGSDDEDGEDRSDLRNIDGVICGFSSE